MAQVVTPPAPGFEEEASKNWYRSESLRKVANDLVVIYNDIENHEVKSIVNRALDLLLKARHALDPRLHTIKPNEPPKKPRNRS